MRAYMVKYVREMHAQSVKAGRETQKEADAATLAYDRSTNLNGIGQPSRILLSSSGGKLFYRHRLPNGEVTIAIYDGASTYQINTVGNTRTCEVWPGLNVGFMSPFVLPGLGLPGLPIIEPSNGNFSIADGNTRIDGAGPVFGRGPSSVPPYESAHVDVHSDSSGVKLTDCVIHWDDAGNIEQKWDFSSQQQLGSRWVAGEIQFTDYQGYQKDNRQVTEPSSEIDYTIESAREEPVDASQFLPETWLKNRDTVMDTSGDGHVAIEYHPKYGSLPDQLRMARYALAKNEREAESGRIHGNILSGLLLACGMFLASLAYVYWRRKRRAGINR